MMGTVSVGAVAGQIYDRFLNCAIGESVCMQKRFRFDSIKRITWLFDCRKGINELGSLPLIQREKNLTDISVKRWKPVWIRALKDSSWRGENW